MKFISAIFSGMVLFTVAAHAQIGDKAGEAQKPIVPRELIPPAPPLSPAEALKSFQLATGLRIEIVASEPLVEDPVFAQFDPQGRLWVVEMRGYMPDLDGSGEDAPVGRVAILRDTDGDGKMDERKTFLDKLILPRALTLVRDGVLIGAPPKLWFCRDTNGDDQADEKIEIASDFGVQVDPKRPQLANPEAAPNNLMWGLDNWIYSAAYTAKFRNVNGKWERAPTIYRGQWGLSQDDVGHLFYDANSDQLRGDIIPDQYIGRNPNYSPVAGANVQFAENQLVWPTRVNPGINRGYRPEMLRDGKLKEFTAACSPFIFRSDLFPAGFYGNAFVAEPAGNLVRRNVLIETNGTLLAKNAYEQKEFLASTDERFRPVGFTSGPDGALYIIDMYHGVLQHRLSLTTYLREQSAERGLDKPLHMGRIYRVVPENKTVAHRAIALNKETQAQWIGHLSSSNSWWRETAQRLLVERRDLSVVPGLKNLALKGTEPLGRIHALWTLHGLNALDQTTVQSALKDSSPKVRAAAIRVSEILFNTEDKPEILASLNGLKNDKSPEVQLQLALTLGEARDSSADYAMATLLQSGVTNLFLSDAILTGLYGRELELLEKLLSDAAWNKNEKIQDKFFSALAATVFRERKPDRVTRLLELILSQSEKRQIALLDGILLNASVISRKPVKLKNEPDVLSKLQKIESKNIQNRVAKMDSLMIWPGKPGAKPEPVVTPLTVEQKARFEIGKTLYAGSCAACHQVHGLGMDGLAPPLADSDWVLGPEERIIRIVLHGVRGPIKVNEKKFALDMPGMGTFDDEQIAAILTYIRREWENKAAPVEAKTVHRIRSENAKRMDAWTQAELLAH